MLMLSQSDLSSLNKFCKPVLEMTLTSQQKSRLMFVAEKVNLSNYHWLAAHYQRLLVMSSISVNLLVLASNKEVHDMLARVDRTPDEMIDIAKH